MSKKVKIFTYIPVYHAMYSLHSHKVLDPPPALLMEDKNLTLYEEYNVIKFKRWYHSFIQSKITKHSVARTLYWVLRIQL